LAPSLGLVGRAVEVDQQPIDDDLVEGVLPSSSKAMVSLNVLDGLEDALAEVPALVVVAQLDGLVGPGAGPDGTAALPTAPSSRITSTSSVGLPRLSRISRALMLSMLLMNGHR